MSIDNCPVIVSASRSTDIPAFFSPWFANRLQAGYMRWNNPFNANQVQCVSFRDTRVIVFWSKNPKPLILTESLTIEVLLDRISRVAGMLRGYTEKLVISFADISGYKKVRNNLAREHVLYREFTPELMLELAERQQRDRLSVCATIMPPLSAHTDAMKKTPK